MSRPLRLLYPGAWYHVMNRGRNREVTFFWSEDYLSFVELLKESTLLWGIRVSAYCLMPNHYHLLLQTKESNLDRCMRHINGIYTQRFNRRHKKEGQLFRGRYKSILVEEDQYLLQLVKYIHRNPLRANLVSDLKNYKWSSHWAYLSTAKKWDWLNKDFIFNFLGEKKTHIKAYKRFIFEQETEEILAHFSGEKSCSIIGSEKFKMWVKEKFAPLSDQSEITEAKILTLKVDTIKEIVARSFKVNKDSLNGVERKVRNDPRDLAIYITRNHRRDTLEKIGEAFGIPKYSTVSTILLSVKARLSRDRYLKKILEQIENKLHKSQEQT